MTRRLGLLAIVLVLAPMSGMAQGGGPPLITDDPDTPGPGYWEINLAAIIERSHLERRTEGPLADINYGVGQRIQLKFEFPWLSVHETRKPAESGPGNSVFGVKWRFLGREGKRVAWATYPQWEFNTSGSMADKGIVNEGWSFLLPTELTVQIGKVEINTEQGRIFAQNGGNGWISGLSTEIELPRGVEVLGELHRERIGVEPSELFVNVGARESITPQMTLLFAAGTTGHNPPGQPSIFRLYVGIQFNLPHAYDPTRAIRRP